MVFKLVVCSSMGFFSYFEKNIFNESLFIYNYQPSFFFTSCVIIKLIAEQLLRHREILEEKETEIESLKRRLKAREAEVNNIREEEMQRAQVLQMAVMNYVGKVPQSVDK